MTILENLRDRLGRAERNAGFWVRLGKRRHLAHDTAGGNNAERMAGRAHGLADRFWARLQEALKNEPRE